MKEDLDNYDRTILDLLIENGRMQVSDIGEKIGLSRPAVAERVEQLQKQGMIRGFTAAVKNYPLEDPVIAFVAARHPGMLKGKAEAAVYDLSRKIEVLEAHSVAGEDCIFLKVRVQDIARLNTFLQELQEPPLLMETRTTIVLNTYFEKVGGVLVADRKR